MPPVQAMRPDPDQAPPVATPFGTPPLLGPEFLAELLASAGDTRPYDPRLAYALAVMSAWAYSDRQTLAKKLQFYGLPNQRLAEVAVTNDALFIVATAYVLRSDCGRLAIIGFRGTEPVNLVSWLTDAEVITARLPEQRGQVHRGFLANLEAVWDGIEAELARTDIAAPEAIYLTGHSLGGAMAVLAAMKLETSGLGSRLRGIYTYGQPAVGDTSFAAWGQAQFGTLLYRHVYNRDIVPRLPPASTGRFLHFGTEYHSVRLAHKGPERPEETWAIRPSGKETTLLDYALPSVLGALLEFVTRRTESLRRLQFPSSLDDHGPQFYLKASRDQAHASRPTPTA